MAGTRCGLWAGSSVESSHVAFPRILGSYCSRVAGFWERGVIIVKDLVLSLKLSQTPFCQAWLSEASKHPAYPTRCLMPLCVLLSQLQPQHALWIGSFLYLKCFSSFPMEGLSSPFPPLPRLLLLIFQISVQIIITSKAANVLIKLNHLILLFLFFLNFLLWNNYWPTGSKSYVLTSKIMESYVLFIQLPWMMPCSNYRTKSNWRLTLLQYSYQTTPIS